MKENGLNNEHYGWNKSVGVVDTAADADVVCAMVEVLGGWYVHLDN